MYTNSARYFELSSATVMATDAATTLPSLPHPSNYTAEPGRLFGWGAAKREAAFPGAETIDAAKHICHPGLGPSSRNIA